MDKTDPLLQLKDIHLPTPISWWPLASAWYVLIFFVFLFFVVIAHRIYKRHLNALAKKQALALLNQYQKYYKIEENNVPQTCAHVSELLRRVALVYYPRKQVAGLHGEAWIDFLNQTGKGTDFNAVKDQLLDAPFKPGGAVDLTPLFITAQNWIKQRKVPCSN